MPPIFESRGGITTSKSIQCEPDLNEAGKGGASSSLLKDADSKTGSQQIHKLAYDNGDVKCVKCKKPLNDQKDQENADHAIIRTSSCSESEKYYPERVKIKDSPAYIDKLEEQKQCEVRIHSFNDEIMAYSQSDVKATAKLDIPAELLESAHLNNLEETVPGITKFSGDGKDTSEEDDSDNKNDKDGGDGDNPPETTNHTIRTSEQPASQTHSRHYGRQDSNVPVVEADECSSPVEKAKFVIGVTLTTEITQLKGPADPAYLPEFEGKNSCLSGNNITDFVSLNSTSISPNDNLLEDGLPKEEQTQHNNDSSELIVNKLEMGKTNSNSGVTYYLLTVENVEKMQSHSLQLYAFFSAPANPRATGDSPMEFSHENSKPQDEDENDDGNDDDVIAQEGSVSDNDSFKSGPADALQL